MEKESLIKAADIIINKLEQMEIPIQDKVELMINIRELLNPETYESEIAILQRERKNGKRVN